MLGPKTYNKSCERTRGTKEWKHGESWNEVKFPVKIIYIFVLSYFIAFANID